METSVWKSSGWARNVGKYGASASTPAKKTTAAKSTTAEKEPETAETVVRGDQVTIAHHDTQINNDDHVIVFLSDRRHVEQVERLFSGPGTR